MLWIVPDGTVFQFPVYFFQPLALLVIVKDTPSAPVRAWRDLQAC